MEKDKTAWEVVTLARHPKRPTSTTLIQTIFPDFIELHGDQTFGDDSAFITGIASIHGLPITIIAQEKGKTTEEKIKRNFGMPHPEGYRKALRLAKQAEKFSRPVLFIIDTTGAYPGIGAEERGQATMIAKSIQAYFQLKTPSISVILSEGGSGGALAIGIADRVWMFENATYSILSPEGFASILYKDSSLAKEAAQNMKLTSKDLFQFGMIDKIIREPELGLHTSHKEIFSCFGDDLYTEFKKLLEIPISQLLEERYEKYRKFGHFSG
ncbi:MAG: acetyl-CoA carboxylase carboxyltransferase subunit alpha [Candidatus Izemoplasmatales bacterium]|nr:acetyl-CoA carboxylase carboxyltransferase subunit alpha [Candidatus Izemoplasmatales bacterium]